MRKCTFERDLARDVDVKQVNLAKLFNQFALIVEHTTRIVKFPIIKLRDRAANDVDIIFFSCRC